MRRDWKPGEVGVTAGFSHPAVRFLVTETLVRYSDGDSGSSPAESARPLVVIDPENWDDVRRLSDTLTANNSRVDDAVDIVQAALREFANPTPPKPEEPTGLGAVVEDADGSLLVRIDDDKSPWTCYGGPRWSWDDVDAVRVLSNGYDGKARP